MIKFSDRSIQTKLMMLFTATASIAMLVACGALWVYETIDYLSTLRREAITITQMLAQSSAAAITFNDGRDAHEILAVLRAESRIQQACLYDRFGNTFATYSQAERPATWPVATGEESTQFTISGMNVHYPILLANERIGELYIRVRLDEMYFRLARFGGILSAVLFLAILVAIVLSSRWQRLISGPIIHLTKIAGKVSQEGNYSIRAAKSSNDEMGMLIDQFNSMMEQINHRDRDLQEAQDKLEIRVAERTADLQQEIAERLIIEQDLLNATATAQASNQAKSAFLANMSHELRTPLNAIIGYSEMLQEDAEAAQMRECAQDLIRIQMAGRHLLSLVSDILDLSKIEAGKLELNMEMVQVSSIIDSVEQTIVPLARKNGNKFVVERSGWNGLIYADPTKFYQSLLNLLSNAVKFTEHGTVSLAVEVRKENERDWVCWDVKDTGIGIGAEGMEKLFHAFSQVDSSATRKHGGTGLGLAISQRLCRLMGGYISVKSSIGEGSTFTIHMPMPDESRIAKRAHAGDNVRKKTVLAANLVQPDCSLEIESEVGK